jgi:type IV pilus assembly protein PilM
MRMRRPSSGDTPWWKREIHLRPRARGTVVIPTPVAPTPPAGSVSEADAAPEPPRPVSLPSIWPLADVERSPLPLPTPFPSPPAHEPVEPSTPSEPERGEDEFFEFEPAALSPMFGTAGELEDTATRELLPEPEPEPEPERDTETEMELERISESSAAEDAQAAERVAVEPAAVEPLAVDPVPKTPLLKREVRLKRPKRGPKGPESDALPAARAVAKARRRTQSVWERELTLPRRRHSAVKLVGLRLGSTQLAAAHVSNNGSIELLQLARSPLPPGLVVGGEVREPLALASEIKAFFAEHKLPTRNVRLGVASNRIGVRMLEVPAIDDPKAFANAIRFRAQELLPIPVTDAVLDHVVLGEFEVGNAARMCRVLLAFAHRDLVARHADACRQAGLKLSGVDLDAFALLRALSEPRAASVEPTQAVVAVAIGSDRTVFAVSDGRICDFVRVLEWGGSAFDAALVRSLDLTLEHAREVKHQLVLSDGNDTPPRGLDPAQATAARALLRDELRVLGQEIVSSLRFYQTRPGSLAIGEVLVTGGGAELPGLSEELEHLVGVPVRAADPFCRVKLGKNVKRPVEGGSFAVAIGLGIES